MDSRCLICGDLASPKTFLPVAHWNDHEKICVKLKTELSVVLLLRKILRLSQVHLESLLQNYGDPSSWGVNLCSPCNRVFVEAEFVHERLLKLHIEFDELASNLRRQLKGIEPVSLSPLRIQRKGGRKKRNTVKFVTPCSNLTRGPLDCIRVELFKRKFSAEETATTTTERTIPFSTVVNSKEEIFSSNAIVKVESSDLSREILSAENTVDNVATVLNEPENEDICFADNNNDFNDDSYDGNLPDTNGDHKQEDGDGDYLEVDEYECESRQKRKITKEVASKPCADKNEDVNPFSGPQPIKLKRGYYKCPICGRKALSKSSSHGHILRAHYDVSKPFHCHLCRACFKREVQLRQHLEDEHNSSSTPLDDPEEEQDKQSQLTSSIPSNKKGPRIFECDICPKMKYKVTYKSSETLEAHKKLVHLGIKRPYVCNICDKSFKLHAVLRHHMYVHRRQEKEKKASEATKKPFCHECNRSFKNMMSLEAHLTTKRHLQPDEYPYQCELCPKGYYQKANLTNHHAQEHFEQLGLQPFKCSYCGNVLSSQRALDHHVRIRHTKDTLFRCEPCDLGFMEELNYNRHLSVVHSKEKPFLCSYCPKKFSSKNHLETHTRIHTGEKPYRCPHCSKDYSDRPTYKRHLETHGEKVYKCSICEDKQFKVWHSYRLHMKTHNEDVYKRLPQNASCRITTSTSAVVFKSNVQIADIPEKAVSHQTPC